MRVEGSIGVERRVVVLLMLSSGVIASGALALGVYTGTQSLGLALAVHVVGTAATMAIYERYAQSDRSRIDEIAKSLRALADGDTAERLDAGWRSRAGDLGEIAEQIERLRGVIGTSIFRMAELSGRVQDLPEHIAGALATAERSAEDQEAAIEETASLFANINTSIRGINSEVENLAHSNEETAASIQQMSTAVEQVASTSVTLQESVESSTASIHQLGTSIRRVAENADEVQTVAQETATATAEMDRAIQEVGEHVRGASELTKRASESADQGSEAVNATINGIAIIRDQTLKAKRALEGLADRIGEIGQIATVIGGISDETNLLSLNAAIIAAQAGEHGKAFAVVADQVKTLAQRASGSAKQIEEMIQTVQEGSNNAVSAMASGIDSVEQGVERSRVAGESLLSIRSAASEANGQVAEIARATEEQALNSKHLASAANRVSENVEQISHAMSEQSAASDTLLRSANAYLDMCRQMAQAMEEQRATGRYITANSSSITDLIRSIQSNTANHQEASRQVGERFELLLEGAHGTTASMPAIVEVVTNLRNELRELDADASETAPPGEAISE